MQFSVATGILIFIGPAEMLLFGLIVVVIIFGQRAPEVASRAGESFGEFQKSKESVEEELDGVSEEFEEVREEIENVREETGIEEDVAEVKQEVDKATSLDTDEED